MLAGGEPDRSAALSSAFAAPCCLQDGDQTLEFNAFQNRPLNDLLTLLLLPDIGTPNAGLLMVNLYLILVNLED